jgi:hypothetical protein
MPAVFSIIGLVLNVSGVVVLFYYPMFDILGVLAGAKSLILLMWGCDFRQNVGTEMR